MAELLRVKAQILAAMPQYGRGSAINCLTEALAVAKAQSALALELRSTMDLSAFARRRRTSAIRPAMTSLSYTAVSRKDLKRPT